MLLLYTLIYAVLFSLVVREMLIVSSTANPDDNSALRAMCRTNVPSFLAPAQAFAKYAFARVPAPIYVGVMLMTVVPFFCFVAQIVSMFVTLYLIRWALVIFATAATLFSSKFRDERIGIQGSLMGWVREVVHISYDGTDRGVMLDCMRKTDDCNPLTAFNWLRILKFNLFNCIFAAFILLCTGLIWVGPSPSCKKKECPYPSKMKPQDLPGYTGAPIIVCNLLFVACNFVGSFM